MRKYCLLFLLGLTAASGYSQPTFVPGYFITQDGKRTEGQVLIRNADWRDNPRSFDYRASDAGEPREVDLSNVVELGLSSGDVFRRYEVGIDRSLEETLKLTNKRSPDFSMEPLFLRVVVSGKTSLFQYDEGNLHRFFYTMDQTAPTQLVYKRYLNADGEAAWNEGYKQQLFNDLKCETITKELIESLKYATKDLKAIILTYNSCQGFEAAVFEKKQERRWVTHLTARVGFAMNSLDVKNIAANGTGGQANMDGVATVRPAIELESILPFATGLWAAAFEVAYMNFSSQISSGVVKATYSTFDIHFGLRKYFPVSETGKLYLTVYVLAALPQGSADIGVTPYGFHTTVTPAFAFGYKVNRISAEFYLGLTRSLMSSTTYEANFSGWAVNVGYTLNK